MATSSVFWDLVTQRRNDARQETTVTTNRYLLIALLLVPLIVGLPVFSTAIAFPIICLYFVAFSFAALQLLSSWIESRYSLCIHYVCVYFWPFLCIATIVRRAPIFLLVLIRVFFSRCCLNCFATIQGYG